MPVFQLSRSVIPTHTTPELPAVISYDVCSLLFWFDVARRSRPPVPVGVKLVDTIGYRGGGGRQTLQMYPRGGGCSCQAAPLYNDSASCDVPGHVHAGVEQVRYGWGLAEGGGGGVVVGAGIVVVVMVVSAVTVGGGK